VTRAAINTDRERMEFSAKWAAQRFMHRFGYEVRKRVPKPEATPINVFPMVVQDLMRRRGSDDLFFVQIGAHDGLHYDPIRPFVVQHHWRGILVEPQPKVFQRLVENYRGEPQLIFENLAVGGHDGEAVLYTFRDAESMPEHASMLASFNQNALLHNTHGYRGEVAGLAVPVLTIQSLLHRHGVRHVDLLQIDTEGFDYEIIKMLGSSEIRPTLIHFESAFLHPIELAQCTDMLGGWGYRVLTVGIDTLAYRQDDDEAFEETFANKGYA
jgi:FkbM family methyltransferase